jgi:hypothetical protein
LDANPTIPYELLMYVPNGGRTVGKLGGMLEIHEFRLVTGSGPVAWESLPLSTGPTGEAAPTDTQALINADIYAQLATVSGGASTLAAVTGISTDAKTLIATPNSYSTMRGLLGAAPTASPTFTTALTAANPTFTGTVTIPDGSLAIADTSGLQTALDTKAPIASPTFTGTPTAPTATPGTNTTQVATTAFVLANAGSGSGAPLASPAFTGNPTAPTPTVGDNDTSIATTAFVKAAVDVVAATVATMGNNVVIPNATLSTARNHPVTGAVLPAAPACCVTWTTVLLATAPTAFDVNGDIWFNKES